MKLVRRLTFLLLVGTTLILAIHAALTVRRETALFDADSTRDHVVLGHALAAAVSRVWQTEGPHRALEIIDRVNARESGVRVRWRWIDEDRGALARLGPHPSPGTVVQLELPDGGRHSTLVSLVAVAVPGPRAGAIELRESTKDRHDYVVSTVLRTGATTLAIVLVCSLVAMALGVVLVGRPVRALVRLARRVGQGDLNARATVKAKNELGELARELNAMVDRLGVADRQIRKETQARIRALDQLRHADRLATVGRLASGIAHELGTPINVVRGRARMIERSEQTPNTARDNARIIVGQSDRITAIIRQLLDFARAAESRRAQADLRPLVEGVLQLLEPMAAKRSVRLSLRCEAELPRPDVDPAQIQQVVSNLVINAVQAMTGPGEVRVDLSEVVASRADGPKSHRRCIRLEIRDNGPGMPPEVKNRVFEPFFTTKDVGDGTGLGLSVAWGIVGEHGGWMDVESEVGTGTVFSVYVPLPEV